MGELDQPDPLRLRIGDDERHQVAEILRHAAGEGRIDFEELDERLEATYAAKTYADLVPITIDLPSTPVPLTKTPTPARATGASPVVAGHESERALAIMGGIERRGDWIVPAHFTVLAVMGGAELDLREARFSAKEVVLTINAVMGGAEVVVNAHTRVVMEGTGIMGGYSGPSGRVSAELDDNSVTVRVRGVAICGGVSVIRKPPRGESRKQLR
jgi:uncharacterized membrane protein